MLTLMRHAGRRYGLLQYLAAPRVGHLETVYHFFAYLQKHNKSSIIFDPTEPYHDPVYFIDHD
jgi:hypothetical protein